MLKRTIYLRGNVVNTVCYREKGGARSSYQPQIKKISILDICCIAAKADVPPSHIRYGLLMAGCGIILVFLLYSEINEYCKNHATIKLSDLYQCSSCNVALSVPQILLSCQCFTVPRISALSYVFSLP